MFLCVFQVRVPVLVPARLGLLALEEATFLRVACRRRGGVPCQPGSS